MLELGYILAQRRSDDGDDWIKFVFGALIFAFWIISAIASALSKKHEKERRERVRQQLEHPEPAPVPKPPHQRPARQAPQVAMRTPAPVKPRQPARQVRRAQQLKQRPVAVKPAQVFSAEFPQASGGVKSAIAPAPPAPTIVKPQPAIASAVSIRRWLTPTTLRQQFVLTEILQPPKGLRDPPL